MNPLCKVARGFEATRVVCGIDQRSKIREGISTKHAKRSFALAREKAQFYLQQSSRQAAVSLGEDRGKRAKTLLSNEENNNIVGSIATTLRIEFFSKITCICIYKHELKFKEKHKGVFRRSKLTADNNL